MSGLGALVKATKAARKAEPFYSAVDEAAMALTRGKGTGKEFMTELAKTKGVKPAEIKDRGLQKIEAMPKMTKEQFLDELEKRPAPQVEEKVLREPSAKDIEDRAHELAYDDAFDELRAEGMDRHEAADIAAEEAENNSFRYIEQATEELAEDTGSAAHGNYTIAGGENYREMLLKVPSFKGEKKLMELEAMRRRVDPEFHSHRYNDLTQQIDALKAEKAGMPEQFQGVKAHFGGEPGVLASIRVSDRKGPNGEKVLHVEEIQSDWHQQGRKKGYAGDYESEADMLKKRDDLYDARTELVKEAIAIEKTGGLAPQELIDRINGMNDELRSIEELKDKARNAVPDAPFKKNWHELAMKRVLNYAAENGYDKVAITPGAEQASRYNLAKQVEAIRANLNPDGTYQLGVQPIGKNMQRHETSVKPEKLDEMVGKDLADKIRADVTEPGVESGKVFSGLDLEVGGEGMKGFYDKMLPDYLNSYGKKYGTQVGEIRMPIGGDERPNVSVYGDGSHMVEYRGSSKEFPTEQEANAYVEDITNPRLHSFDITPEMRQEITGKGMPLYQQIGIPTGGAAAGMGALEEEDQGFKGGGKVKRLPNTPEAKGSITAIEDDEEPMSSMPEQQPMMPPMEPPMEHGYADGGAVTGPVGAQYDTTPDMQDGGQVIQGAAFKQGGEIKKRGQVKFASNPDTMWLELMSRS